MATATLKDVSDFFKKEGTTLAQFRAEWQALSDKDKEQIKEGIGNGTLNY